MVGNEVSVDNHTRWAVVIGDDSGGEEHQDTSGIGSPAPPVQYRWSQGSVTLLQVALWRARRATSPSHVMLTALNEEREWWGPHVTSVLQNHRVIANWRRASWLSCATAVLAVARQDPDAIVTIFPAKCYVEDEAPLSNALDYAYRAVVSEPKSAITLGMAEPVSRFDEDYLIADGSAGCYPPILSKATIPEPMVAQRLREQGALVASGIIVARVQTLVRHLFTHWPAITGGLTDLLTSSSSDAEINIPLRVRSAIPRLLQGFAAWSPPTLPMRMIRVKRCGWYGLRTPRAIAEWRGTRAINTRSHASMGKINRTCRAGTPN